MQRLFQQHRTKLLFVQHCFSKSNKNTVTAVCFARQRTPFSTFSHCFNNDNKPEQQDNKASDKVTSEQDQDHENELSYSEEIKRAILRTVPKDVIQNPGDHSSINTNTPSGSSDDVLYNSQSSSRMDAYESQINEEIRKLRNKRIDSVRAASAAAGSASSGKKDVEMRRQAHQNATNPQPQKGKIDVVKVRR